MIGVASSVLRRNSSSAISPCARATTLVGERERERERDRETEREKKQRERERER
jgi:hypothetical protein